MTLRHGPALGMVQPLDTVQPSNPDKTESEGRNPLGAVPQVRRGDDQSAVISLVRGYMVDSGDWLHVGRYHVLH